MTVAAPPRPPQLDDPAEREALEALIEEARRRARRRRIKYAASALLIGGAAMVAFFGFGRGGGTHSSAAPGESSRGVTPSAPIHAARNGSLTVIGGQGIVTVGPKGGMRPLFRCAAAKGCNLLDSIAWAPDGRRLAFVADTIITGSAYDGIHVIDGRTGTDHQLTGGVGFVDLTWSPDGSSLAYAVDGWTGQRIYVMRADGEGLATPLPTGTEGDDSSPSWSPDGTQIAFANRRGGRSAVYVMRADGSARRRLAMGADAPAWSPDGTKIAYRAGCGMRIATPEGRDVTPPRLRRLCASIQVPIFNSRTGSSALSDAMLRSWAAPVWSPDGRKIAMKTSNLWVMNADGSHLREIPARLGLGRPSWQALRSGV